ncbi:hypothetical protein [Streptomyces sp. SID13031]|uniref:hypothetical protein n=1 Tax=Streptomyces sp. SID13031 TaxID=2706046 RepID=UPI0013CD52B1|nr:hypothetical protein [Streptomyces sp. SID13031]NEA30382.1 hypothetical protein [Streptomyces sp. SID13031]
MTGLIVFVVIMIIFWGSRAAAKNKGSNPNARAQKLLERIQAQQARNQPPQLQGQYTQPTSGQPLPGTQVQQTGRAQSSAQLAGMLTALLQAGQQGGQPQGAPPAQQYAQPPVQFQPAPGQYASPGQYQPAPSQYAPPGQFQPHWQPQYQQHAPHHTLPAPNSPLEIRVRELMKSGHEVPAIRLLCDEQDLGIIEAQKYARSLIAPATKTGDRSDQVETGQAEEENRYVGSAAFAESLFDLDRDETVWASGWVEKPEPEDRTDMDELWQTVRNSGRPANPAG